MFVCQIAKLGYSNPFRKGRTAGQLLLTVYEYMGVTETRSSVLR